MEGTGDAMSVQTGADVSVLGGRAVATSLALRSHGECRRCCIFTSKHYDRIVSLASLEAAICWASMIARAISSSR